MKLLTRYNRINLLSTIAIFLLSGIAFFFALHLTLLKQMDEDLRIEQREITNYVAIHGKLFTPVEVKDQETIIEKAGKPYEKEKFKTVKASNNENYRQLCFAIQVGDEWYNIKVRKSLEATEHITQTVFTITFCTILLVLLLTVLINSTILKKLWQPFYSSLHLLQRFKVNNGEPLILPSSTIDEFAFMNSILERTTSKAIQDYERLKEFTENASHELQTPLSIIRSKLEMMMQGENLTEYQFDALQSASEALDRLARMNQSLLLLTKIENEQFTYKSIVDLTQIVKQKAAQFNEIWQDKSLNISLDVQPIQLHTNKELIELLLNNLFSNATRHNYENGHIHITLKQHRLCISNTGHPAALNRKHLFQRFYNPSNSSTSNGLGLAVIQQICTASGFNVAYDFEDGLHIFTITFTV
ncbi:sensor histidine kinase [Chitinophaga sancti]|uniref:histidine kinase n=1 Tax=Chitinophaga sancti TaxID=1004 RepID=A0A1K1S4D9_9BACT|nr:HAMP domain-containing sensor histidine kinase [Chitinophaga sancti]WQD63719.1 HAMP domain-containing sensor histidine kinase [Chitinophaga sancti]WQG90656.1 HAMP domain-containing sensor histidine kinase [Chitinophaga sancti]SFW79217.1 Signal transduction histidine kinase [Chitinophaga sancti]